MTAFARILSAFALALATQLAGAAEVAGVKLDERTQVGGSELVLNGAGLRTRFLIKVYAMGVYLPERKASAAEAIAAAGPKRVRMVLLRGLSAQQLADALVEGMQKNTPAADLPKLQARIDTLRETMLAIKEAPEGTSVTLDYLPDSGTRLALNGEARGQDIAGADFYAALLRIWLGDKPVQDDLKQALLGK